MATAERYNASRLYRNALFKRVLVATNRMDSDQGPHIAQLLADAMRQTDELAANLGTARGQSGLAY